MCIRSGTCTTTTRAPRFFAYLSLFTFAMLTLVTADNLVQMFFGWEGVGLASYLLIGFWYQKPSANAAAMKAFVVNRVGDFGFLLGIFGLFVVFGSANLDTIFAGAGQMVGTIYPEGGEAAVNAAAPILNFGRLLAARCRRDDRDLPAALHGRDGQVGADRLHTWLPDAMEGPTQCRR